MAYLLGEGCTHCFWYCVLTLFTLFKLYHEQKLTGGICHRHHPEELSIQKKTKKQKQKTASYS